MKAKFLFLSIFTLLLIASCDEDDEVLNQTGNVSFTLEELVEIENATIPLNVNIGIDNFNHSGGAIEVSITGEIMVLIMKQVLVMLILQLMLNKEIF